jgi:hypothetical protein
MNSKNQDKRIYLEYPEWMKMWRGRADLYMTMGCKDREYAEGRATLYMMEYYYTMVGG